MTYLNVEQKKLKNTIRCGRGLRDFLFFLRRAMSEICHSSRPTSRRWATTLFLLFLLYWNATCTIIIVKHKFNLTVKTKTTRHSIAVGRLRSFFTLGYSYGIVDRIFLEKIRIILFNCKFTKETIVLLPWVTIIRREVWNCSSSKISSWFSDPTNSVARKYSSLELFLHLIWRI